MNLPLKSCCGCLKFFAASARDQLKQLADKAPKYMCPSCVGDTNRLRAFNRLSEWRPGL